MTGATEIPDTSFTGIPASGHGSVGVTVTDGHFTAQPSQQRDSLIAAGPDTIQRTASDGYLTAAKIPETDSLLAAAPEELFGTGSVLVVPADGHGFRTAVATTPFYGGVVLALFVAYIIWIYYFRNQLMSLVGLLKSRSHTENLLAAKSAGMGRFIMFSLIMAMLGSAVLLPRLVAGIGWREWPIAVTDWVFDYGTFTAMALFILIALSQWALLKTAGYLFYRSGLTSVILKLKGLLAAMCCGAAVPFVLLSATGFGYTWNILLYCALAVIALVFILLMLRTLQLFISEKVSILFWILYLCGVEIFPVSFFVALILKNT